MYLKQVELQGFKSFAAKSTFEFHQGITCIVGPNGSGKSNISDAVRWVLGEQSARQLRGHNMQDVIFAGTQNRRPVSFASVSLLLDNSDHTLEIDFSEVKVTRRIYRSGESEYLLNGAACRLRDIQELFYDTGIGKEGYSLIGQGQIEKIISGKPQDRRELFDEAAGIVKFKRRKAAAQKKLEAEQEHLVRVNDIITELEHRVGPLKHQSEKAKIYLQKKEMLKEADLQLFALQAEDALKRKTEYETNLAHLNEELSAARKHYEDGKEESARIEEKQHALEEKTESLRNLQNESVLQKNALEHQIELLAAQGRADALSTSHYTGRLADIEDQIRRKRQQQDEEKGTRDALNEQILSVISRSEETAHQLAETDETIRTTQERIDEINARILSLMEEKTQAEGQSRHYDTLLQETRAQRTRLKEEETQARAQRSRNEEEANERDQALRHVREVLVDRRESLEERRSQLLALTEERNALRDAQEEKRRVLAKAQSQLETVTNMAERYDGYGQSIRKVMQKHHPGVIGVVADLIHVDQAYETAVETALGGSIQNIVTKDADAAREMIDYLKRERLGRATFLPLTEVRGRKGQQEERALSEDGVIGTADTLVACDQAYRGVVSYLLGGILVVRDMDHALAVARKYRHSLRIVTLEGEYLRPGGSMTGGAFRNSSNLLARTREMETLSRRVGKLTREQQETTARLDEITEQRIRCRNAIGALQDEISHNEITESTVLSDLKRLSDEDAAQERRLAQIEEELRQIDARLKESGMQRSDSTQELCRIDETRAALETENAGKAELFQEAMQKHTALSEEAKELLLNRQSLAQNVRFAEENIDRLAAEESGLAKEADEIYTILDQAKERASAAGEKEAAIREQISGMEEKAQQAQTDLEEALREKEKLSAAYRAFFDDREALAQDMARLEKEELRLTEGLARLEESIEKQDEYIWDEYGLTRREAMAQGTPVQESEASLRRRTKEIAAQIRDLGNVNVNAIEEYKQVGERYEMMTAQRDDVLEAAQNLEKMIGNLETGMRKQFREQFARIQTEFQKVFEELFGGGHGTLELVQGEDDLETGIEIIAQPPGKKLQNMMQLSGGEKALAAICLLFAIQNLKPSPFCVLDEIEAALDEPNVDRFAQYLKRLSGRTQFIVITHRRGTMAAADRLYGVTMQEKGVSAQVCVSLVEEELAQESEA